MEPSDPTLLLAVIQADVLVRCFVIALVIVTPYWLYKRRQIIRPTAERPAAAADVDAPGGPRLEDVVAQIPQAVAAAEVGETARLTVPHGVTVDGSTVDPGTADALVRDALRRSGLVVVAELDSASGRTLELRPLATPPSSDPT